MGNILRYWNQNRKRIIIGIVTIIFLILLVQILNAIAREQNRARRENIVQLTQYEQNLPTESIIGGQTVSINTTKTNVELIEEFVEKCNKKDITGAYNMLTQECREVLFPKEENFKTGYYDMIFKKERMTDIKNFLSKNNRYTYLVKFYEDVLSTGKIESENVYQDYITVDTNSQNGKININSFICKNNINKSSTLNGVKITVLSQEIYKENEKYQVKIENNSNKRILIDTRKLSKSIYLIAENNVSYNSNIGEIAESLYEIPSNMNRTYRFKFNKIYSSTVDAESIVFSDIVADCEKYKQTPEEVNERLQISIIL